jgi:hypothetical protein
VSQPAYVLDQMGHHSIKVTVDIWANQAAVDRLDDPSVRNLPRTASVPR